jgi:hypothetical protein
VVGRAIRRRASQVQICRNARHSPFKRDETGNAFLVVALSSVYYLGPAPISFIPCIFNTYPFFNSSTICSPVEKPCFPVSLYSLRSLHRAQRTQFPGPHICVSKEIVPSNLCPLHSRSLVARHHTEAQIVCFGNSTCNGLTMAGPDALNNTDATGWYFFLPPWRGWLI